jgi:pimeloyl-ACP methyl ester carboxylesterase
LAETYRVVQYEQPGFGEAPNDSVTTLDEQATLMAAVIEATGIERYHLLGTSFGGAVAVNLASQFPERLLSLVLDAPAAFRHGARSPFQMSPEELVAAFRTHPEREPSLDLPPTEEMARVGPFVQRLLDGTDQAALITRMSSCPVRTLVLFGTEDGIIPSHNGRIYRRHLRNSVLLYVHDAGHDIMGDRSEAFLDVVGDFLRRGMGFLVPDQDTLVNL